MSNRPIPHHTIGNYRRELRNFVSRNRPISNSNNSYNYRNVLPPFQTEFERYSIFGNNNLDQAYEIMPRYDDNLLFDYDENGLNDKDSSIKKYGILLYRVLRKMISKNILSMSNINEKLTKTIMNKYFSLIYSEKINSSEIKSFISCLPTLKKLKSFISKNNLNSIKNFNNIFFIKMCLDIQENYLKAFDYPLFQKYKTLFLDVALIFFKKLNSSSLNVIIKRYEKNLSPLGNNIFKKTTL